MQNVQNQVVIVGQEVDLLVIDPAERKQLVYLLLELMDTRLFQFTLYGTQGIRVPVRYIEYVMGILREERKSAHLFEALQAAFKVQPSDAVAP